MIMKTHAKFLTILIAIFGFLGSAHASRLDGIWTTRDNRFIVEIRDHDQGIQLRQGQQRWSNYYQRGNRYENERGSFCRIIDSRSLEWYDRNTRQRYTLYRDDGYGSQYERNRSRSYQYDRNGRNDYDYTRRNIEGKWFNESTGQHIHVKERREGLRVKFHGERWITFRRSHRGVFVDVYGNKWSVYRNRMEYQSFNRDLVMHFTKGEYLGRRHNSYFRFR